MLKRWWSVAAALALGLVAAIGGLAPQIPAPLGQPPETARALDAVVTTCDEAGFDAALAAVQADGGGTISFDCDGPVTIPISNEKNITGDVTILGGGQVTFSGVGNHPLLFVNPTATLEIIGLTVENGKYGANAGAIYNGAGTLIITASTFNNNSADHGGAIYNGSGTLTITASTFNGNNANISGGAIHISGGTTTITASTFNGNGGGDGGAIGIGSGMLTITASTFSGNNAGLYGGAIYTSPSDVSAAIETSTFSGNSAPEGGAIVNRATMEIETSTFSDNTAESIGGAIYNRGDLTITASTLSGNSAAVLNGGAIQASESTPITASILDNNTVAGALRNCSGSINSGGSNLSDDETCGFTNTANGDIQNSTAVNLGTLADNGGPTRTMLPQPGSDALGNADCALTSPADQRGAARPATDCDIGAVEVGSSVPVQIFAFVSASGENVPEGGTAHLLAVAYGPDNDNLVYAFDCDNDSVYETAGAGTGNRGDGACELPDNDVTLGVLVCDGDDAGQSDCATATLELAGANLPPVIQNIATNEPVPQGQPVTVTITATDPAGINDPLTYAFDCDGDDSYDIGPGTSATADCPLDPGAATTTITVLVADDDGGSATGSITVSQTAMLCANRYTGALGGPLASGACPPSTVALTLPGEDPTTLCIHPYTGQLTWTPRGTCSPVHHVHVVPDDGPLDYCRNTYTGKLRYSTTGICSPIERTGVIPG